MPNPEIQRSIDIHVSRGPTVGDFAGLVDNYRLYPDKFDFVNENDVTSAISVLLAIAMRNNNPTLKFVVDNFSAAYMHGDSFTQTLAEQPELSDMSLQDLCSTQPQLKTPILFHQSMYPKEKIPALSAVMDTVIDSIGVEEAGKFIVRGVQGDSVYVNLATILSNNPDLIMQDIDKALNLGKRKLPNSLIRQDGEWYIKNSKLDSFIDKVRQIGAKRIVADNLKKEKKQLAISLSDQHKSQTIQKNHAVRNPFQASRREYLFDPMSPLTLVSEVSKAVDDGDFIQAYLTEISQIPLLSREDEINAGNKIVLGRDVIKKLKNGARMTEQIQHVIDEASAARNLLITSNLRYAAKIAFQYYTGGIPVLDLIQAANHGVLKSATCYTSTLARFTTYSTKGIRQSIGKYIHDHKSINTGISDAEMAQIALFKQTLEDLVERSTDVENVDMPEPKITPYKQSAVIEVELDAEIDDQQLEHEMVSVDEVRGVENSAIAGLLVKEFLQSLSDRDAQVVNEFYNYNPTQRTLRDICKQYGVSATWIHFIIKRFYDEHEEEFALVL